MSAPISKRTLQQGHKVTLVAHNYNQRPVCLNTVVTDYTSVTIPYNGVSYKKKWAHGNPGTHSTCILYDQTPRFRCINLDAITLDTPLATQCSSGLLADSEGQVQALWMSFLGERNVNGHDNEYHLGLDVATVLPVLERLQREVPVSLRSLNIELIPVQMAQAGAMGLSTEWMHKVEQANPSKHQAFMVKRTEATSESAKVLRELDLILAIQGKTVTRLSDFDVQYEAEALELTILRQKKEMTLTVPTEPISGAGTNRVVFWAGAVLQGKLIIGYDAYNAWRGQGVAVIENGLKF